MAERFRTHLETLHPTVRDRAAAFLAEAFAAGLDPRVQEGHRSRERQAELYAQGRTAPGAVVTKARPGQSNHNYGVAFDVVPGSLLTQHNWAPESPLWAQMGSMAEKHGLEWGGNWKFVDRPHFQLAGASWRQLQNDPAYASWAPSGTPTASPGGPAAVSAAPTSLGDMFSGSAPDSPEMAGVADNPNMLLGNFAMGYLRDHQARQEQRRAEEEAEQVRRQALLGGMFA